MTLAMNSWHRLGVYLSGVIMGASATTFSRSWWMSATTALLVYVIATVSAKKLATPRGGE